MITEESAPQIVNTTSARHANRYTVLQIIRSQGPLSCAEMSRILDVPPATVARVVDDLKDRNVVQGRRVTENLGVGKPPTLIDINPEAAYFVGVELVHLVVRMALANFKGEILAEDSFPTEQFVPTIPSGVAEKIKSFVNNNLSPDQLEHWNGVSFGVSGDVTLQEGKVLQGFLGGGTELISLLKNILGVEVMVDNDANLATLGEHAAGAARGASRLVCLLDRGFVGTGLYLDGRLYRGHNNAAGELCAGVAPNHSHRPSSPPPFMESMGLERAIREQQFEIEPDDFDRRTDLISTLVDLADNGDNDAESVLSRHSENLGLGLYRLAVLFDPEILVLSGDWTVTGQKWERKIRCTYDRLWEGSRYGWGFKIPDFAYSPLGQDGVVRGALARIIKHHTRLLAHNASH